VLDPLDLSAAFDMIDHCILLQRLERVIGIKLTAFGWFKSYLSDRFQFVLVKMLGPILFTLYMLPLVNLIRQHSIHFH